MMRLMSLQRAYVARFMLIRSTSLFRRTARVYFVVTILAPIAQIAFMLYAIRHGTSPVVGADAVRFAVWLVFFNIVFWLGLFVLCLLMTPLIVSDRRLSMLRARSLPANQGEAEDSEKQVS
jgi:hypothetical protein